MNDVKERYDSIDEFIQEFKEVPTYRGYDSEGNRIYNGLEFLFNGHFYRLTKDQPTYETQFLPDGTEAHYFLEEYIMNSKTGKFDTERLIDVFSNLDDVLENCIIQGIKFKDLIISPQVSLEGVD